MLVLGMLGFVLGVATSASAQPPSLSMDIYDVRAFLQKCPASDPVYALIRQNFELRLDDQIITSPITCTEPLLELPAAGVNSEALYALQGFRLAYYMNDGTAGHLPWTSLGLYDWMADNIAGINFKTAPGQLYCCDHIDGNRYVARSIGQGSNTFNFPATFPFVAATLAFYGHEVRHAAGGPGHTNGCPYWPAPDDPIGCDETYDLGNLGSYGVQYLALLEMDHRLFKRRDRLFGPDDGLRVPDFTARAANGYPDNFVSNPPPLVTPTQPYGGPCQPAITTHPQNQTIAPGQTATLSVAAVGAAPAYQWYVGTKGNTTTPVSGATSKTFTTPVLASTTSYWVRASNPSGTSDSNTATVKVYQLFSDHVLTANASLIRSAHITELRTRIDALRVRYTLTAFPYMDTAIGAGITIKAQHILDLRAALTAVYVAAGLPVPMYTDPGLPAGTDDESGAHRRASCGRHRDRMTQGN